MNLRLMHAIASLGFVRCMAWLAGAAAASIFFDAVVGIR